MIWTVIGPALFDDLGLLPSIFLESDERPAREQANERYAHGGGWRPQPGWNVNTNFGTATYPGDPELAPIAFTKLRNETIMFYPHAYVAIIQPDGSFEMSRMD